MAVRWYRLAAAQGYGGAQYNLGLVYAIGRGGVQRDPLRAYMWFTLAAMSQSGNAGSLVTQTRDVFAGVMTRSRLRPPMRWRKTAGHRITATANPREILPLLRPGR